MKKRSLKDIERDVKVIKEASMTATSMKELAQIAGLTPSEVATSLSRHPRIDKWVHERVKHNLAFKKQILLKERACVRKPEKLQKSVEKKIAVPCGVVIDSSIANMDFLHELLMDICPENGKVIMTRQTIWELKQLMSRNDEYRLGASALIKMLKENPKYEGWFTAETDDTVVDFCARNNQSVTLFTSDPNMRIRAMNKGVKVKYIRKISMIATPDKDNILQDAEDIVFIILHFLAKTVDKILKAW